MTTPQPNPKSELTWRAIVLGMLLSALLAGANAYLGLFAGMTVSASIPAAVVSMGLMKAFRGSILENNLVQTAASAGESAAAGAIFTLPALLLLGAWTSFPWIQCVLLVGSGGVLGVLFTIFLRVPLIVDGQLPYPEGVATAQVLLTGHARLEEAKPSAGSSNHLKSLLLGGLVGAGFKLLESGLGVFQATLFGATRFLGGAFYLGAGASPALLGVGYIVGLRVAFLVCLGGLINWLVVIPLLTVDGYSELSALDAAWASWSKETRYLGVGAMTFSGLFTLFDLRSTLLRAARGGMSQLGTVATGKVEVDLPLRFVGAGVIACAAVLTWLFSALLPSVGASLLITAVVLVVSLLFSAVAAYMAGLLGSSNNPVSGVTIATIILVSLALWAVGVEPKTGAVATIFVGSVVCTAAAIGGDNMQDLKAGHLLSASPRRQQVMQLLGVFVAALVLGPVLQLLAESYGFFEPTAEHPRPLTAPQAALMAQVARGMFGGQLPWKLIAIGVGLGAVFSALDSFLKYRRSTFRTPPLALSLGLYLPVELSTPVLIGGIAAYLSKRGQVAEAADAGAGRGLLLSAGLITGEALMGIVLAATMVLYPLHLLRMKEASGWLSAMAMALVVMLLSRQKERRAGQAR